MPGRGVAAHWELRPRPAPQNRIVCPAPLRKVTAERALILFLIEPDARWLLRLRLWTIVRTVTGAFLGRITHSIAARKTHSQAYWRNRTHSAISSRIDCIRYGAWNESSAALSAFRRLLEVEHGAFRVAMRLVVSHGGQRSAVTLWVVGGIATTNPNSRQLGYGTRLIGTQSIYRTHQDDGEYPCSTPSRSFRHQLDRRRKVDFADLAEYPGPPKNS